MVKGTIGSTELYDYKYEYSQNAISTLLTLEDKYPNNDHIYLDGSYYTYEMQLDLESISETVTSISLFLFKNKPYNIKIIYNENDNTYTVIRIDKRGNSKPTEVSLHSPSNTLASLKISRDGESCKLELFDKSSFRLAHIDISDTDFNSIDTDGVYKLIFPYTITIVCGQEINPYYSLFTASYEMYTISWNATNCSVSVDPSQNSYTSGQIVTITVKADNGYRLSELIINEAIPDAFEKESLEIALRGTIIRDIWIKAAAEKIPDTPPASDNNGISKLGIFLANFVEIDTGFPYIDLTNAAFGATEFIETGDDGEVSIEKTSNNTYIVRAPQFIEQ